MPRPPAHFPPPPDSPRCHVIVETLMTALSLTTCAAEVALGIFHELSKKEIAVWLGKSPSAVDALQRRIHFRLGVRTRAGVAARVGVAVGKLPTPEAQSEAQG